MRLLLAIDSFKGCLSSAEAERAVCLGIKQSLPDAQVVSVPMSDGGEGMLEAFATAVQATLVATVTESPRMVLRWNGKAIVDISREFLNSNGAEKHISVAPAAANASAMAKPMP